MQSNDAHFTSFVSNLFFAGETPRYTARRPASTRRRARPCPSRPSAGKVLSEHGELIGVVTILHDHTEALERERLYEQLKQASDELEEKVREATAELVRQNELLRRQPIQLEQASALSPSSWPTCRTSSARRSTRSWATRACCCRACSGR